jgi:SAM-dependent methyltransferase
MGKLSQLTTNVRAGFGTSYQNTLWMDFAERFRLSQVLPYVHGVLLDIGCGYNNLVRRYGRGVGVDVYPWPGVDVLVDDCSRLPFSQNTFDTVTIVATLNHIPNRDAVMLEVRRVLKYDGHLVVTMIGPIIGWLAHIVFRQDERLRGGMVDGELKGMTDGHVLSLLYGAGFDVKLRKRFELGLNRLYLARMCE